MLNRKSLARRILMVLGALVVVSVAGYFWILHSLESTFAIANFKPLEIVLKKTAADILVARQPSKAERKSGALLDLYQQDPAAFEADAKLFDTWMQTQQIGKATLRDTVGGAWVRSTADAAYLGPDQRRDPWNHSLCLLRRGEVLLVMSGGPTAPSSPVCRDITIAENEITKLPHGRLLETPSGNLILVVDTKASISAVPSS